MATLPLGHHHGAGIITNRGKNHIIMNNENSSFYDHTRTIVHSIMDAFLSDPQHLCICATWLLAGVLIAVQIVACALTVVKERDNSFLSKSIFLKKRKSENENTSRKILASDDNKYNARISSSHENSKKKNKNKDPKEVSVDECLFCLQDNNNADHHDHNREKNEEKSSVDNYSLVNNNKSHDKPWLYVWDEGDLYFGYNKSDDRKKVFNLLGTGGDINDKSKNYVDSTENTQEQDSGWESRRSSYGADSSRAAPRISIQDSSTRAPVLFPRGKYGFQGGSPTGVLQGFQGGSRYSSPAVGSGSRWSGRRHSGTRRNSGDQMNNSCSQFKAKDSIVSVASCSKFDGKFDGEGENLDAKADHGENSKTSYHGSTTTGVMVADEHQNDKITNAVTTTSLQVQLGATPTPGTTPSRISI